MDRWWLINCDDDGSGDDYDDDGCGGAIIVRR